MQAQKRLHGKPAASFFSRAYTTATGAILLPSKTVAAPPAALSDEAAARCCSSSATPSLATATAVAAAGATPPNTAEEHQEQAALPSSSTPMAGEQLSVSAVVDVVVKPHPHAPPSTSGTASLASVASVVSAAALPNNINAVAVATSGCASAHDESCTSTVSDGHDTTAGSTSVLEAATLDSSIVSRNSNTEGSVIPRSSGGGNKPRVLRASTVAVTSRGMFTRTAGSKSGGSRPLVRGGDGWSTSRGPEGVCSLDGELMLLDGILHDRKVRTWVETTLVPAKTDHHRFVASSDNVSSGSSRDTGEMRP